MATEAVTVFRAAKLLLYLPTPSLIQDAMSEPAPHILVVDDDREIRDPLAKYLAANGYRALAADSAATARRLLKSHAFDLIVLDIMMPGEDGLNFCRSLRESSQVPVLFLTARSADVDRIVGI